MEKHEDLMLEAVDSAKKNLSVEEREYALYYFIGALQSLLSTSKDGNVSAEKIVEVYRDSVDYHIGRRK